MMQEQKAGLSKREKRLLLLVSIIGLFYLAFQFGFLPSYERHSGKTEEFDLLRMEKVRVEGVLLSEEHLRDANEQAGADYKALEETYLLAGANTNLGRMLSALCADNGLRVEGQSMGQPADFTVPGEDGGSASEGDRAFSTVTVTMTVSGGYEAIKSLLDAVDRDPTVRVSRVSFSLDRGDAEETGLERVSITFEVTLLNSLRQDGVTGKDDEP
jgi:hypothetical protein